MAAAARSSEAACEYMSAAEQYTKGAIIARDGSSSVALWGVVVVRSGQVRSAAASGR
jgi:hypothetical protein